MWETCFWLWIPKELAQCTPALLRGEFKDILPIPGRHVPHPLVMYVVKLNREARWQVPPSFIDQNCGLVDLVMPVVGWDQISAVMVCFGLEEGERRVYGSMPRLRGFPRVQDNLGVGIHFHKVFDEIIAGEVARRPVAVEELVQDCLTFLFVRLQHGLGT